MKVGLVGRVVIVTGAAAGVGRAIAMQAAEAGASLVLSDRDAAGLAATEAALSVPVATVVAELRDEAAPAAIADAARARFGRIDGLVNAAALTTRASFLDGTVALWDELFAVNSRAPFFLMQAAIADMLARKAPGSIVNITSVNAPCGGPDLAIYSATKGALATLTKNAANAHVADRIRVNALNLGWVASEGEHRMQSEILGRGPGWLAEAEAMMPLGRLIEPSEPARFVTFLLSDASEPMTGIAPAFDQRVAGAYW